MSLSFYFLCTWFAGLLKSEGFYHYKYFHKFKKGFGQFFVKYFVGSLPLCTQWHVFDYLKLFSVHWCCIFFLLNFTICLILNNFYCCVFMFTFFLSVSNLRLITFIVFLSDKDTYSQFFILWILFESLIYPSYLHLTCSAFL